MAYPKDRAWLSKSLSYILAYVNHSCFGVQVDLQYKNAGSVYGCCWMKIVRSVPVI